MRKHNIVHILPKLNFTKELYMEGKAPYSSTTGYQWHSLHKSVSYNNGVDSHLFKIYINQ